MLFWALITAISLCVAAFLLMTLRIPAQRSKHEDQEQQFYKAQLIEVERDVARGVLLPQDAELLHAEIARRLLQSEKHKASFDAHASPKSWLTFSAVLTTCLLTGGSLGLYKIFGAPGYDDLSQKDRIARSKELHATRPSLEKYLALLPPLDAPVPNSTYTDLIEKLRQTVAERPNDLEGQSLLARTEASLQNFMAASIAQKSVIRLKGADAAVEDHFDYAELLILAGRGYVSPEAENALEQVLSLQNDHKPALYYMGLLLVQIDRPDRAFRLWQRLLAEAEADSQWLEPIRSQINGVAIAAGLTDFELPPLPIDRGPSKEEIEAAGEMSAEDRQTMIENMVEGLAERLGREGGPPEEWAKLLRALIVLGLVEDAIRTYNDAQVAFSDDAAALAAIQETAEILGIAE